MNTNSNTYTIIYSIILVLVVAVSLTFVAMALKPKQEDNIRIEKMQNILASSHIEATVKDAIPLYDKYITKTFVVNSKGEEIPNVDAFTINLASELKKPVDKQQLPVFIATIEGIEYTILPVRGKGLWGPIWGYIALEEDYNTIYGVVFDHKSETPGLGAEINTPFFEDMFEGKQIFNEQGNFVSIGVLKGGASDDDMHAVDA
ncbi:MAG TPA: NADH:ubiquinone reductase (Na(+)-transporting) subunit C, partial [Bacteroidales bacterium]